MKISDEFIILPKSKIKAGEGISDGKYPFFTSSDTTISSLNTYLFDDELVVLGTGGKPSCNYYKGKFSVSTDNFVVKAKGKTKPKYLYYFLRQDNLRRLEEGFHGAGLKHLGKDYLLNIDIPNIDIDTQNQCISCLDLINKSISAKKEQLNALDSLIKSRFSSQEVMA